MTPGRKPSTTTSAPFASRRDTSNPFGFFKAEPYRALVAVDEPEKIRHGRNPAHATHRAGIVPCFRVLDLDYVRPHVGEVQRRHRTGKESRQVEDADPGKRFGAHLFDRLRKRLPQHPARDTGPSHISSRPRPPCRRSAARRAL